MKRWIRSERRLAGSVALLLATTMLPGCGSGGGGGGVISGPCIDFQADGAPAALKAVATAVPSSQCGTEVAVELTGVSDVLTVSFEVTFDPTVASYDGYSLAGSRMSSGGAAVDVQESVGTNSVLLGVTRLNTGVDFTTTGTVIKLKFSTASGAVPAISGFTFTSTQVLGSEAPPVEKNNIQWLGGTLVVG